MAQSWPADKVQRMAVSALAPYAKNARLHSAAQVEQLAASIREWGFTIPILVDQHHSIIAGHGRVMAAQRLGIETVPVMVADGWTPKQIKAYRIADNRLAELASWDVGWLAEEMGELADMAELIGFSDDDLGSLFNGPEGGDSLSPEEARRTLAERFGLPPFSILNAREGWWQDRKRAWLALGIESELGRGENLLQFSETVRLRTETNNLKGGLTFRTTLAPYISEKRRAKKAARVFGQDLMRGENPNIKPGKKALLVTKGQGWGGGVQRRDAAFYKKKRAWEKANGRKISTPEFREKYWEA